MYFHQQSYLLIELHGYVPLQNFMVRGVGMLRRQRVAVTSIIPTGKQPSSMTTSGAVRHSFPGRVIHRTAHIPVEKDMLLSLTLTMKFLLLVALESMSTEKHHFAVSSIVQLIVSVCEVETGALCPAANIFFTVSR